MEQDPIPGGDPTRPSPLRRRGPRLNQLVQVILVCAVLFGIVFYLANLFQATTRVAYSYFKQQLIAGNVDEVLITGELLQGRWKVPPEVEGSKTLKERFSTILPPDQVRDEKLLDLLDEQKVTFDNVREDWDSGVMLLVYMVVPLVMVFIFFTLMRRGADPTGAGGIFGNFGRSPAKRFVASSNISTFDDVADMENAKRELQEIVEFLKDPVRFQRLGATIPKGVLLMGPPGTGKTLLARATAGEAGVPFYSVNGSEFIQMFVGVGASRVRDLFKTARDTAPCLVFIDEIDAVGRVRGAGVGGGHDEREQTLNQILGEMDGFNQDEAIIVIAATNRPDVLDPALLRPGRFDRHVMIDRPNRAGRIEILKVHARKVPLASDLRFEVIAAGTTGFSGADLKNLVNEAALNATRKHKNHVELADFEYARDKILMGPKREEVLSEKEKLMTACHEAGHAVLAWALPEVDPLHKVTIIPHGRALGVTQLLPNEERHNISESQLHSQLAFMMGGRAAEKLIYNEYTAGAEDDLKRATQMARRMVGHWGMSELIGPVAFRQAEEHPFLGKEFHEVREFSEETARRIDEEVQRFLTQASKRAREFLERYRDRLDTLTTRLVEKEVLDDVELRSLLGSRPVG